MGNPVDTDENGVCTVEMLSQIAYAVIMIARTGGRWNWSLHD
jgi:hypothetical protein